MVTEGIQHIEVEPSKGPSTKIVIWGAGVLAILVLAGLGLVGYQLGWFSPTPDEDPLEVELIVTPSPTALTPSPSPSPSPTASTAAALAPSAKQELKIAIFNGTGKPGQAGKAQTALKALGYSEVSTGNRPASSIASGSAQSTRIIHKTAVSTAALSEIKKALEGIFVKVEASTSASVSNNDVEVVTGTEK